MIKWRQKKREKEEVLNSNKSLKRRKRIEKRARAMCCGGLISLDRALRYSQNVEFGLVFVLNRVEEVKSTYIEIAA